MQRELTEEQVNKIVEQQLKRLQDDYDLVQQFNILPTNNYQEENPILSQLKHQFPDAEISSIIKNDLKDYELTVKFDAALSSIQAEIDQNGLDNQLNDNPYQTMGNDSDDNQLFSDDQQNQDIHPPTNPPQSQNVLQFPPDTQSQPQPTIQDKYKPQQRPIDSAKIMQIANKMSIQTPQWMNNTQECQKRIKELFKIK